MPIHVFKTLKYCFKGFVCKKDWFGVSFPTSQKLTDWNGVQPNLQYQYIRIWWAGTQNPIFLQKGPLKPVEANTFWPDKSSFSRWPTTCWHSIAATRVCCLSDHHWFVWIQYAECSGRHWSLQTQTPSSSASQLALTMQAAVLPS